MLAGTLDVAVIGGGLAGLATAYFLQEHARAAGQALRLVVLEAEERAGGKLITERTDGFVVDGGADGFSMARPDAAELCRALGLDAELVGSDDAHRQMFVLAGGKLHAVPAGMIGIVPTDLGALARSSLLGPLGRLRMARESANTSRPETADESIAVFVRRRFGQEAVEKLAYPLLAGPFLGDPEWLSMRLTYPEYVELEQQYGSLIRGMQARAQSAPAPDAVARPAFLSFRTGMQTLSDALAARLEPGTLLTGRTVTQISRRPYDDAYLVRSKEGRDMQARRVVLAVAAPAAASVLGDRPADLVAELRQIRYLSSVTVALGYRKEQIAHPLDGFGFAVAAREPSPLLACTWTSTNFPAHAPPGHVLLRAVIAGSGGAATVDLLDLELTGLVRAELGRILGVNATPVLERVYRWRLANPQYDTGHLARLARLDALVAGQLPGGALTGSAYRGVDIPATIRDARETAARVLAGLG